MKTLGNIIWIVFGGIFIALEYLVSSIVLMFTIIGIPFGIQTLKMATLALLPFGKTTVIVEKPNGCLSLTMNIIWFFVGGFWIFLSHFLLGIVFAITIIAYPWARQHFKLATLALTPFGREIINK